MKKLGIAALCVIVAYLGLNFGWATQPRFDVVPVGIDWTPTTLTPPQAQKSATQRVNCNSLFDSEARSTAPLPELKLQPQGKPALAFQRTPCDLVHSDAREILALNTVAALGALGAIAYLARRHRRHLLAPA